MILFFFWFFHFGLPIIRLFDRGLENEDIRKIVSMACLFLSYKTTHKEYFSTSEICHFFTLCYSNNANHITSILSAQYMYIILVANIVKVMARFCQYPILTA